MPKKIVNKKELSPAKQQEILALLERIETMFGKISSTLNTIDSDTRRILKKEEIKNILENIHNIKN